MTFALSQRTCRVLRGEPDARLEVLEGGVALEVAVDGDDRPVEDRARRDAGAARHPRDLAVDALARPGVHAAVAAGDYPDVAAASAAMGRINRDVYLPDQDRADSYDALYAEYRLLHDYLGRGANDVMLRLREIRNSALRDAAFADVGEPA